MSSDEIEGKPIAAIPLPSADLINFRFDQQEKTVQEFKKEAGRQFDQLNEKLDYMSTTFVTRVELTEMQTTADKEHVALWGDIKAIRTAAKWWVATGIAAVASLAGMIYTLTHLHR